MNRTVLLLCALFVVSFGCNCGIVPPNPQNNFCRSDFVAVLTIVSRKNATSGFPLITYTGSSLSAATIFKSPNNFPADASNIKIVTEKDFGFNAGACGVNWLQVGKTYLINGAVKSQLLSLHSCAQIDSYDEWANVPSDIKDPLQDGTYKNNCPQ
uniref:NTR domain-containing protein n=1 Tax=Steinernema glaseri TaxID=37863 RepID=A0A1I7ZN77_9BILA